MDRMHVMRSFHAPAVDRRHPRPPRPRPLRPVAKGQPTTAALIGAPSPGTEDFRAWSEWLGHRLADSGPAEVEAHLAQFSATALDHAAEPALARIVADRTQPAIVRSRAFFKVAMVLCDEQRDWTGPPTTGTSAA